MRKAIKAAQKTDAGTAARAVLFVLAAFANRRGIYEGGCKPLQAALGLSQAQVYRLLSELRNHGLISVKQRRRVHSTIHVLPPAADQRTGA